MDTTAIQRALIALGYPLPRSGADGDFGGETRSAMQAFQRKVGLPATDRPDASTIAALREATANKPAAPAEDAKLPAFPKPTTRRIVEIIVHCTATPEDRPVSVDTIRGWHIGQGWKDIGYHWVVLLDGTIAPGRPESQVGSHVAGHNTGTLGVVYVGGDNYSTGSVAICSLPPVAHGGVLRTPRLTIPAGAISAASVYASIQLANASTPKPVKVTARIGAISLRKVG
ncbi:MAG: hypothetical protein DI537_08380 [Stutzerimonas stutzeri]|nr:MAG: hypothetical protein DI537_08380 [Stutzerimonas stutzeri]